MIMPISYKCTSLKFGANVIFQITHNYFWIKETLPGYLQIYDNKIYGIIGWFIYSEDILLSRLALDNFRITVSQGLQNIIIKGVEVYF